MFKMFGVGCCCASIGFVDAAYFRVGQCLTAQEMAFNTHVNLDDIANYTLIFDGLVGGCPGNILHVDAGQWASVKDWIEAGGRFVLACEYEDCMDDYANVQAFLTALGSTMTITGNYEIGCQASPCTAGTAQIGAGLTCYMGGCSEITGGASVLVSPNAAVVMMAVEQLGDGFLFLSGDSNIFTSVCGSVSCELIARLWGDPDDEII